jgi:hypothetical protein
VPMRAEKRSVFVFIGLRELMKTSVELKRKVNASGTGVSPVRF